jgi:hypothetical protein
MEGAREAVRVVVAVTKFMEGREDICSVLETFHIILCNILSDRNIVNIKNVALLLPSFSSSVVSFLLIPTLAAWPFKSSPLGVRELDFENASDSSTHAVVENVGML